MILFFSIVLCYVLPSFGQYYPDKALNDTANYPYWMEMMQDPNANFYATVRAFNKYWKNRTDYKGNGWKVFKRWEYLNKDLVLPNGKLPGPAHFLKERQKFKSTHNLKSASGNWTNIGPTTYPANVTSQPAGLGRVNCFGFDPVSASTFYAGTPSGGIWKTTDNGASWTILNEDMPTLGVSSILVNPNNGDEILIGTGDRDASDSYGLGVYKSTDGGSTWSASNSGMPYETVGMMIRNPADANMILAATKHGIYKSIDGGANWTLKDGYNLNFREIKFKPGDFNIVYASEGGHFYRSTDAGETWSQIALNVSGSRLVIGVSANNPAVVYLLQTAGSFAGLLKSTDSGATFTTQSTSPNIMGDACDGSGTGGQAGYDLCIAVDPNDANIIYAGGINVWKSTDGGVNWVISSHNIGRDYGTTCGVNAASVHADQHTLQWSPLTHKLLSGNDGGVYYTDNDGADWTQISSGLGIAQIYRLGQSASQNNLVATGHQDNGTFIYDGTTFTRVITGDGMECIIDYSDANYRYGETFRGRISRLDPAGHSYLIKNNITESGAWVTPYILHNSNPNTMFAGFKNVWRTTNVKAADASSVSWTAISTGETSNCDAIEQSLADDNVLYAARGSVLKRTGNANDANPSWTTCTSPSTSNITALETNDADANIVYATAGSKVYKSTDKGVSWTDISGTLPNININTIVYRKNSNEELYIGTKSGVYMKNAGMSDWIDFSTGLPVIDVRELEIYYDTEGTQDRLKAATYGRGLWQSDLGETGVLNPTHFTAEASSSTQVDLSWVPNPSGNNVMLAYNTSSTFGTPADGTSYTAGSTIAGGGTVLYKGSNTSFNHTSLTAGTKYYYKLWSYDGSTNYSGGTTANETPVASVADFSVSNTISCTGSLIVNFTDQSTGAYNSWAWDVDNNGTTDYTTQNPVHTYYNPGLYSVKLTISNGDASATKDNLILVMNSGPTANNGCTFPSNNINNNNGNGFGIYRFALGNIDNTTPHNDGEYKNYTCTNWTLLELNQLYNVTVQTGTVFNEGAKVYIDYNDDGTFDPGEAVASFPANKDGTRTLSFTTPSSGVVLNKPLRLRVLSKYNAVPANACDVGTWSQAEDYTVYFRDVSSTTWTGATDNDWHTASNWNNGIPGSATDVVIPAGLTNYPTLLSAGECNNLTIQSDASGTGSLKGSEYLTINGTINIKRYVTGYTAAHDGWHLISSPVTNQRIAGDWTPSSSVYDIYTFDESKTTNYWLNQKVATNNITSFIPGKGYLVAYQVSGNRAFTGPLNSENVTISGLTNTSANANSGWHLVGNPFTCAIDYNAGTWTKTNIDAIMQVWNSKNASYKTSTEVGGIIPAMNGFMVHTTGNGTLTIPLDSRTHNPANWYKSDKGDFILLKANDPDGNTSQSSIVRFNAQATEGYDADFDSYFIPGFAPMFYSRMGDEKFALNTLPEISDILEIPFDFIKNGSTNFNIELAQTLPGVDLYLIDKKSNIEINLTDNPVYQFTSDEGDPNDRFILQLKTLGTDDYKNTSISIYSYNNTITIKGVHHAKVIITDMLGQAILTTSINGDGFSTIQAPGVAPGIYEVSVIKDKHIVRKKVALGY